MLNVYVYGSGECDQLGLGDMDELETKVPLQVSKIYDYDPENSNENERERISFFNTEPTNKVYQIACGGMHTLVLTTMGQVYSWGCNDEGALGRLGEEKTPALVHLGLPVRKIAGGDSHSVAYNPETNIMYIWGSYRVNLFLFIFS